MIQEIFPHRFNNHFLANKNIGVRDFVLHYQGNSLLLKTNGNEFEIPRKSDFSEISDKTQHTFLFSLDDVPCFLIWDELKTDKPQFIYKEINFFRLISQQEIAWISIAGFQLKNWYFQNRFCGKCGTRTQQKPDERAIACPDCNTVVFPKISPAITILPETCIH